MKVETITTIGPRPVTDPTPPFFAANTSYPEWIILVTKVLKYDQDNNRVYKGTLISPPNEDNYPHYDRPIGSVNEWYNFERLRSGDKFTVYIKED